jgi:RNA polymerase sigma-70 factor, ECF subfamily
MGEPESPELGPLNGEAADSALLLRRIAAGDREAFHTFYRKHGARVMGLVRRRVLDLRLAEEFVQDVFVAAWLGAPGYRRELGEPELWLLGIARHKLLDHWRRLRRTARVVGVPVDSVIEEEPRLDADLRLGLEQALAGLNAEQRRIIDLIYMSGLTFGEAARALRVPAGTVKSRVNAALRRMRAFLTGSRAS